MNRRILGFALMIVGVVLTVVGQLIGPRNPFVLFLGITFLIVAPVYLASLVVRSRKRER